MLVLRFLVKLVRLLNSETSANSIALAFALGMFLGLVPLLTLQGIAVLMVVLFFRVNLTAALFTLALFKLAGLALRGPFDALGCSLLEKPSLLGLHTWLYNSPLSACSLNHSITLAATVTGLLLVAPVFFISRALINAYRTTINERMAQLGIVNAFRGSRIYKLYEWLDSPYGG